jgi:DNA mismatch endonuclease, patch repair protein
MNGAPHRTRRDNLTPQQRSYAMSRVRSRDTSLELLVASALRKRRLRFVTHAASLPGRPDLAFLREQVAVFVDGDFWHGYRFPSWRNTVSEFWQRKIALNRARDKRNFAALRRRSWVVVRIWQHELRRDPDGAIERLLEMLRMRRASVSQWRNGDAR